MGAVPQPDLIWRPASANSFTVGRQGTPVRIDMYHHAVGTAASAAARSQNPSQGFSCHFAVGEEGIYCCVDTDDTSWCNGNWASNLESVTIEHGGNWQNGYRSEAIINNAVRLHAWLMDLYPSIRYMRHREVAQTACPCDFPVEEVWNKAVALKSSYYKPAQPVTPEWLKNRVDTPDVKKYAQNDGIQLWDLNNTSQPADGRTFARNTDFLISGSTTVAGIKYHITVYSYDRNIAAGFKDSDLADIPWTPPQPPADTRPEWQKNLVDIPNKAMWLQKDAYLIDLITGTPVFNSQIYPKYTKIEDISATTVVGGKSFCLTEYSFSKQIGKGFEASNLSLTDPTPITPPIEPEVDYDKENNGLLKTILALLQKLVDKVFSIIK